MQILEVGTRVKLCNGQSGIIYKRPFKNYFVIAERDLSVKVIEKKDVTVLTDKKYFS